MKRNAVTVNPLTVTPGSDDDDSNTTNPLMTNYPADDHDVEDSGAPLPSQHRRGSICAYVAIFLAGCALAAAVVGYGIQESRSDADRQFDLEGEWCLLGTPYQPRFSCSLTILHTNDSR